MRFAGIFFLVLTATAQVLTLQDGTPVRLRLDRTVSSASAHVGETVDFEVTEPVINQNYVVIPKGAVVLGRVTKVETKRRFGRAGALELSIDSVRLPDGGTILLRATPEKGEGEMHGARKAAFARHVDQQHHLAFERRERSGRAVNGIQCEIIHARSTEGHRPEDQAQQHHFHHGVSIANRPMHVQLACSPGCEI